MKKHLTYILLIFLLIPAAVAAQSFSATVDNTTVGLNDRFQVTFTFEGTDINSLSGFNAPDFAGFMVLSGPNQSTSMQIINGAVSASLAYSYYLQPKNLGKYTIGSATIKYKGTPYKTDPITIQVEKGSSGSGTKQSTQNSSGVSNDEIAQNVFVRASADKQKVLMGEQVTVTYKLYSRLRIASQMSINKLPQYPGFWAEEMETPENISFSTETYQGKRFKVGVLKKVALFPTQTGELNVTPFELDVPVQVQNKRSSNNVFDNFFNDPFFGMGQTIDFNAKSNSVKINVLPLPAVNVPDSFNGAVGDFSMDSQIDKNSTKTNEPVTLKITISGTGNISLLDMPKVNLPAGFEQYEPKVNEQVNRNGRISGKKTAEYLIVPRDAGKKEIPAVKFSYFDINKKSYVTLNTPSYPLKVEQGNTNSPDYAGKEDVKMLGEDIRYIKTDNESLHRTGNIIIGRFGFWAAVGFPFILGLGLVVWRRREDKLAGNVQLMRYQRAQKAARMRLKKAKVFMDAADHNAFYSEISLALFGYLEDKFHIPKSELSVDRASAELEKRELDRELITEFERVANKCEFIRFAPKESETAAVAEMYNELSHVITEIEKSLSMKKNAA